ncbi:SAM-dependent chlorinase/fluorinase [bacterium]|nr:SAM-dependent chlorinase/fluorinase [bacterium]
MIITLLTDFGLSDPYAGVMKGVILGICPEARLVDISHDITPQNIEMAAFILEKSVPYFPTDTIHCVVVDPGVGTSRKVLIARVKGHLFVAPDNGVLKRIINTAQAHEVFHADRAEFFLKKISATFHGRDIFAPLAAHLANGVKPEQIGEPLDQYVRGEIREPELQKGRITGEIIYFDRFGNAVTNISRTMLKGLGNIRIDIRHHTIQGLVSAYSQVKPGEPLAIIGSFENLEIAVREGSAREQIPLKYGDKITVLF